MAHDVELVEQEGGMGGVRLGGEAIRFPHVSQPRIELAHACLAAVLAPEPHRPAPHEIAEHDAVGVALADRALVTADRLGSRCARQDLLRTQVLQVLLLDAVPVQVQFLGHLT
jgi:hypothetical protein